jgi:hypothetical protein
MNFRRVSMHGAGLQRLRIERRSFLLMALRRGGPREVAMRILMVLVAVLLIGGCSPVKIVSSPDTVTLRYDPVLSSSGEAYGLAKEHCAQYGRRAVPAGPPSGSTPISSRYITFLCVTQ